MYIRHKKILEVFSFISRKECRQLVGLKVQGIEKHIYLSPEQIFQNVKIEIFEIELLIDAVIRVDFYKKGEKLLNENLCEVETTLIKEFFIELPNKIEKLRENKSHLLKPFQKVAEVYSFNKFENDKVCLKTEDGEKIYLNQSRLANLLGLDASQFHILEGSYIAPDYLMAGDILWNGETCKYNNTLKDLNIRLSGKVSKMHETFENNAEYQSNKYDHYEEKHTYNCYNGSYAQNEMGYSDQDIRDVFDGEADAYWNID